MQSLVSTIQTVVLTADVFQLFIKMKYTRTSYFEVQYTSYQILRRMGKNKAKAPTLPRYQMHVCQVVAFDAPH